MVAGAVAHLRLPAPPRHASVWPEQDLALFLSSLLSLFLLFLKKRASSSFLHVFKPASHLLLPPMPSAFSSGVLGTTGAPKGFNPGFCSGGAPNLEETPRDRGTPNLGWSGGGQRGCGSLEGLLQEQFLELDLEQ